MSFSTNANEVALKTLQFIALFPTQTESELNTVHVAAGFCSVGCHEAFDRRLKRKCENLNFPF